MQLSTRGRYAVMAMVDLALRTRHTTPAGPPVCLSEIAASQHLSLSYLEQLFGKLRHAGLVSSIRGPGGGYRLARHAAEVPIAAIIAAVDETIRATRCDPGEPGCMAGAGPDGTAGRCQTHDLWFELGRQIGLFLEGVTLADVIDGQVAGRAMAVSSRRTNAGAKARANPTIAARADPTIAARADPTIAAHADPTIAAHAGPTIAAHAGPTIAAHAGPTIAAHAAGLAAE